MQNNLFHSYAGDMSINTEQLAKLFIEINII